jgi:hypothetical protein
MVRQKPIDIISELSGTETKEEIVSDNEIIVVEEDTIENEENIINIDIKEEDASIQNEAKTTNIDDFASEGEEIIEEPVNELPENKEKNEAIEIVITNE